MRNIGFFVAEQLREIDSLGSIILEPVGRNTAPALALAALLDKDDSLLLVLAADHIIEDEEEFVKRVTGAVALAESDKLVTFGVIANEAHTGYGYIKKGASCNVGFDVAQFVEKPSVEMANKYLISGEYFWNSGMFLFKGSRYIDELNKHRPDIVKACRLAVEGVEKDHDFIRVNASAFELCPSDSIDYAVMEKTNDAVVVPMDVGWSDLGSWSSLWDVSEKDKNGNAEFGDVILHETKNSYVRSSDKHEKTFLITNLLERELGIKDPFLSAKDLDGQPFGNVLKKFERCR